MKRREFLKGMGAMAGLSVLSACGRMKRKPPSRPNIILCMADDQGWGDTGYAGHPLVKTPNLDEMADASLRFDRFYAAGPVCSPTRASVLTGRNPNRCGVLNYGLSMRPQETTIAEALKQSGYATGHFGKWHVGSVQKTSPVNPTGFGFDEWLSAPNYFDMDPILSRNGEAVQFEGESSAIVMAAALDFIRRQAKSGRPFLAVVWFPSPHGPHVALESDRELYPESEFRDYWAEITALDRAVGELRRELRDLGIRDNTLLWFNSDNGGLDETTSGGRDKKGSIYEGGLRVPAVLEWPERIPHPRITAIPAFTSDIYPTLLEITEAGVENQAPLDGISLVPLIEGDMPSRPQPMGFWRYPAPGRLTYSDRLMSALLQAQKEGREVGEEDRLDLDAGEIRKIYPEDDLPGHAAWLDWPWKLHRIQEKDEEPRFELYNLEVDPDERSDLSVRRGDRLASLRPALEAWMISVIRSLNGRDYI